MTADQPQLSVIVATHNRRELLQRCLSSLLEQTAAPDAFEVIVADDGSGDGTAEMAERFEAPHRILVLWLEQGGQAAAQNAAIEAASGRVCLFIDDDVIASPKLVGGHLAAHREEPMTLGVGRLVQAPPRGNDPYARAFAKTWNWRYEELAGRELDWADCYGGNLSAPRQALLEAGGFATDLPSSEDLEIAFRLTAAGCLPQYLPDAEAVHDDQKPGSRILADEERFGSFCAGFVRTHPEARRRLLGWFNEPTTKEVAMRSVLLKLGFSPARLVEAGRLLPRRARDVWLGFVSRYTFWRGVRSGASREEWLQTTRGVPVLMYHAFADGDEEDRFVIDRRLFARHMRVLAALRYRVISLDDLGRALRDGEPLPRRAVVITIDDGYRDVSEVAYPILRRRGFPATVFLVSRRIGGSNDWGDDGAVSGRPILSAEEIDEMRAGGVRFGAHTRTHPSLAAIADDAVEQEVGGSREDLEALLGETVETLTFPYGHYDRRTVDATGAAGFLAACTTWARPARVGDDPLLIPRIEISGSDSVPRFLRKLWLAGY